MTRPRRPPIHRPMAVLVWLLACLVTIAGRSSKYDAFFAIAMIATVFALGVLAFAMSLRDFGDLRDDEPKDMRRAPRGTAQDRRQRAA